MKPLHSEDPGHPLHSRPNAFFPCSLPGQGRCYGRSCLLLAFAILCVVLGTTALAGESLAEPSLLHALRMAEPRDFCGEKVPMDLPEVRERFEREFLLTLGNTSSVILWLKRSRRYFPVIEKMLREAGLPEDLKYVAIAESALQTHVGSPKGAMGYWQFMTATGRHYGLTIDPHRDERRNVHASTRAAIQFFQKLHGKFGSWTLSTAAYNMGENGLAAEMLEQGTANYYELYLPLETQRFLFRILSIKLIYEDPKRFGLDLMPGEGYLPRSCERVTFQCSKETPIRLVAQAAESSFKVIKDLNPEVRGYAIPAGSHTICVPEGKANGFQKRLSLLLQQYEADKEQRIYVVRSGDTLTSIAAKYQVPLPALLIWNKLDPSKPIHPGDRLIIHPKPPKEDGDP